ncbi:PLP-dependent cysteine synthase family protein [Aureimonas pseudogalii]|uniref:Cystathionine beta-synthase n=1 Tax=Aureimonas pseudogalii TaxID=1744844 RepID=A0A7W6MME5_9HYPH|nr:cysteine synthase family protein [Aureimonas pseudogalii]MBB4000709.1 cystathionine beta-synthase [Aureimonas pseudogalii]
MTAEASKTERVAASAADLIGRTPLMELTRTGTGSRLLLKLEQFNPTGSTKVRMAREMVLAAKRSGALKPGGHIVEPTSGNTGTGLALVTIERGYRFTAVVDRHASKDKLRAREAMGTRLVMVEGTGTGPSTVERRRIAGEISRDTGAFWPDQHHNPNNNAGYASLAGELLDDLASDVDYLIGAVGTGGTMCGTVKALRERGSAVTSIGVEPKGSIIFGNPGGKYWQTGAGAPAGFTVGPNVEHDLIDEGVTVSDMDAFTTARVIARRTGLLVGGTAGAAIFIALKRLAIVEPGSTMVALVCDAGEKYLDTVYDDAWLLERGLLNEPAHQRLNRLLAAFEESQRLAMIDHARTGT